MRQAITFIIVKKLYNIKYIKIIMNTKNNNINVSSVNKSNANTKPNSNNSNSNNNNNPRTNITPNTDNKINITSNTINNKYGPCTYNISKTKITELITEYINASKTIFNKVLEYQFTNVYKKDQKFLQLLSDDSIKFSYLYNLLLLLDAPQNYTKILDEYIATIDNNSNFYAKIKKYYDIHKRNLDNDDAKFCLSIIDRYHTLGINNKKVYGLKKKITEYEKLLLTVGLLPLKLTLDKQETNVTISKQTQLSTSCYAYKSLLVTDNEQNRKKVELFNSVRYYEHIIDIALLIINRDEYAKTLGYSSYTSFKYRNTTIINNIDSMITFLIKYCEDIDIEKSLSILKKKCGNNINACDIDYYCNILNEEIKYFKIYLILPVIINIFEKLFKINFVKVSDVKDDFLIYNIYNAGTFNVNTTKTNKIGTLQFIHVDKQSECYILETWSSCSLRGVESWTIPDVVITLPNADKKYSYNNIVIIFKNIFHSIHNFLAKNKYSIYSGTNISSDNLSLVTKIINYVLWDERIISSMISTMISHNNDNVNVNELVKKIKMYKNVSNTIDSTRYLLIAIFDIFIYTPDFINNMKEILTKKTLTVKQKKEELILQFSKINEYLYDKIYGSTMKNTCGSIFPDLVDNFINDDDTYTCIYAEYYAHKIFTWNLKKGNGILKMVEDIILPLYKKFSYNYYDTIDKITGMNMFANDIVVKAPNVNDKDKDNDVSFDDTDDVRQTEDTESLKRYKNIHLV